MSSLIVECCKIEGMGVHPNAERLEICRIRGWQCIVQKHKYNVGDLVIYIPVDAVLPQVFADKIGVTGYLSHQGGNVLRVKTIKLRGVISQGLVVSIDEVPGVKEGDDVAERLGITKYEVPEQSMPGIQGMPRRQHPDFHKYTHIEHLKNYPDVLVEGEECVIAEKLHGCNMRAGMMEARMSDNPWNPRNWWTMLKIALGMNIDEFHVGSHNVDLQETENNLYWRVAKKYRLDKILPTDWILFGEIYGKGIQKLTYDLEDVEVAFFDLMMDGAYVSNEGFRIFCASHNLPMVPELYRGPWKKELMVMADGKSTIASHIREGFVVRPIVERYEHKCGGRVVFKVVSAEYLLSKNSEEVIAH